MFRIMNNNFNLIVMLLEEININYCYFSESNRDKTIYEWTTIYNNNLC